MLKFLIIRIGSLVVVLLGITLLVFILMDVLPGNPVSMMMGQRRDPEVEASIRRELGLDRPMYERYLRFVVRAVRGDLGRSYRKNQEITTLLLPKFLATLKLTLFAMLIAVGAGVPMGILAANYAQRLPDYIVMVLAVAGVSIPVFWLGLLLQLVFATHLHWLPVSGITSYGGGWLSDLRYMVLPSITLASVPGAMIARITRASLLDVLKLDYIRMAHAKGLSRSRIIWRHALKPALIPVLTVVGNNFALLLTGAVLTESVFSYPGIGKGLTDGIFERDFPVVMAGVLLMAVVFVIVNFIVDVLYALVDPRVRYE